MANDFTRRSNRWPEEFDRNRDFTVLRSFPVDGKTWHAGDPVDKAYFTTRRLRQLYENRWIVMEPETKNGGHANYLSGLSDDQLREWLERRGAVPRYGANHASLLKQAERVLASGA